MNRADIIKKLKQYKEKNQSRYNFLKIGLFGSTARNDSHAGSDIDILVEQQTPDLFILGQIKTELEEELGTPIDIIRLHDGINDFLKKEYIKKPYMYDLELVQEILKQILTATEKVISRFKPVKKVAFFTDSNEGMEKLDSICMLLIAIGEGLKNIDKITKDSLLSSYPEINWKGAKAMRDIISHQYFSIDAEIIFNVCDKNIEDLHNTISKILHDLKTNT